MWPWSCADCKNLGRQCISECVFALYFPPDQINSVFADLKVTNETKLGSSSSPCAACKTLGRQCTSECVFAPYFPPDQPSKFEPINSVFSVTGVEKFLSDLPPADRGDAVSALLFDAMARLKDPVYGVAGIISVLKQILKQRQAELQSAKQELALYMNPGFVPQQNHGDGSEER